MSSNNDDYRNRQVSNYLYHKRNINNSNTDIVKAALIRFVTKASPPNTIPNEKQIEKGYRTAQTQIIRDGQIPRGIYEKDVESFPLKDARPPEPVPFNYPFELLQIHASGRDLETRDGHKYMSRVRNNSNSEVQKAMGFIDNMSTRSLSQLVKTLNSGNSNSRPRKFTLEYTPTNPQTLGGKSYVSFQYTFSFNRNQFEYTFEEGKLVILYRYCEDFKFFGSQVQPFYFKYTFPLPDKLSAIVKHLNNKSPNIYKKLSVEWFEDSNNNELHLNLGKYIDSYFNINNRSKMTAAFRSARYPERLYDEAQFKKEMAQLRQKSLFRRNDTDTLLERNKHERVLKFLRKVQEVFEDLGANGQLGNSQMIKRIPVHLSTYATNAKLLELKTPFIAASGEIKKVLEEREKLVNKLRNTNSFISSNNKAKILKNVKNIK